MTHLMSCEFNNVLVHLTDAVSIVLESLDDIDCLRDSTYDSIMMENLLTDQNLITTLQVRLTEALFGILFSVLGGFCFARHRRVGETAQDVLKGTCTEKP